LGLADIYCMIEAGCVIRPAEMRKPRTSRYLVVPVALLALLLVGMTLGSVWHHHAGSSDESNCSICHLSHQPIDRPAPVNETPALALVEPALELADPGFAPTLVVQRVPARAPPVA
jgi:hypothetical protein